MVTRNAIILNFVFRYIAYIRDYQNARFVQYWFTSRSEPSKTTISNSNSNSTTLSHSSSDMADVQRPAIIIPMPVPGMPDAPKFEGKDAREFLEQIEAHGSRAGITENNKLVDFIVRYSSRSIKTDIRFIPEFDPDVEDKTWDAAKKMLLQMFLAQEEPPEVSIRDLEDSCIVWSTDEPFTKKSDVDRYQ
ncbi:hypothetical protein EV360DRAFT_88726 [Lentinula raphanica]|nr:hypothetical protein EV360DRAFT_88726 [Lentinula raphanica]